VNVKPSDCGSIEISAHARLHFGLMEICPGEPHCYGGIGLMVEEPGSCVRACLGDGSGVDGLEIEAEPYWRDRIVQAVNQWLRWRQGSCLPVTMIRVERAPEPHIGLGSGTQFACSLVGLMEAAARVRMRSETDASSLGVDDPSASIRSVSIAVCDLFPDAMSLAQTSGRGKRSFIGMEGFLRGGLIWDEGQAGSTEPSHVEIRRTGSYAFPSAWRVMLLSDRSYVGDSGLKEAALFEQCARSPNRHRDSMLRLVQEELLPALGAEDFEGCSRAIGLYGAMAGEIFGPAQGGIYRSPAIAELVECTQAMGCMGVGQSSWGPTVFAIVPDEENALWLSERLGERFGPALQRVLTRVAGSAQCGLVGSGS
jgi:beta-ribofuranosylaminobenzene 5'-phosphate synthase